MAKPGHHRGSHKYDVAEVAERERQVMEAKLAGHTFHAIAKQLGYADHTGAYRAFKRALRRTVQHPSDEYRRMELERLDRLQSGLWERGRQGDVEAIGALLRILKRRAELLGLDAPVKLQTDNRTTHSLTWPDDDNLGKFPDPDAETASGPDGGKALASEV